MDGGRSHYSALKQRMIAFVLKSTYFQYDGSIYEQQEHASMGSPVSGVKANQSTWRILRNKLWHPRLVRRRSGNVVWMTPLVSHCFEQLFVFFCEKGY